MPKVSKFNFIPSHQLNKTPEINKLWTEELKNFDPVRSYGNDEQLATIQIYIPKAITDILRMDKKFKRVDVQIYNATGYADLHKKYFYISLNDIYNGEAKQTA